MAIFKAISPKTAKAKLVKNIICYVLQEKKTEQKLTYGKDLYVQSASDQMNETKRFWDKTDGREYYHFVQSFPPNEKITLEEAHEMAKKLLEQAHIFDDFEVLVATHKDRQHIHSHFIVNSVSLKNGLKFHYSKGDLQKIKELQNDINIQNGYSPAPKFGMTADGKERTETVSNNRATYEVLMKAEQGKGTSYIQDCGLAIIENAKKATSKIHFFELMKAKGFKTEWNDEKKHIVFTDIEREAKGEKKKSVRLSTLFKNYNLQEFDKEFLENEFERNSKRTRATDTVTRSSAEAKRDRNLFEEYKQHRQDERQRESERIRVQNARQLAEEQRRKLEKNYRTVQRANSDDFSIDH